MATRKGGRRRYRGFTLTELLVVIGLTGLLLTLLLIPLSRTLDVTSRGQARSDSQDSTRGALRKVNHELSEAMMVGDPRPIRAWGYTAWTNLRNRPLPDVSQPPESYLIPNAVIPLRLPKRRYYCINFEHWVTPEDIDQVAGVNRISDDAIALGNCPRPGHQSSTVDYRPITPLEPEDRVVVYFSALKDPSLVDGSNRPLYRNILLFPNTAIPGSPAGLNTYTLYRVEFNPADPNFGNWNLPNGAPNPDFFYDRTVAPNGLPYWQNWLAASNQVVNSETADVIRWQEAGGKFIPQFLCTFAAGVVDEETAQPNREVGSYGLAGFVTPGELPSLEYSATYGHWLGAQSDGSRPIPDAAVLSSVPSPGSGASLGPRIQIYEQRSGQMTRVFDSGSPVSAANPRNRMVAFDSRTGSVGLAIQRQDDSAPNPMLRDHYSASGVRFYSDFSIRLSDDTATSLGMPTSFGAAEPRFGQNLIVTPGSEKIQLVDSGGPALVSGSMRRAGWTGLGARLDRYIAPADMETNEYSINYRTGEITFSDRDPSGWVSQVAAGSQQILVEYQIQTNAPRLEIVNQQNQRTTTDVVRISYITTEVIDVHLGIVQYTRRMQESLPFEVSERIVVRNLKR